VRGEWGAVAAVEQETIRAVVEAYAAGTIELPRPDKKTPGDRLRNAPHFKPGSSHDPCDHPYTAETLQEFLGFKGDAGLNRIKDTLNEVRPASAVTLTTGGAGGRADEPARLVLSLVCQCLVGQFALRAYKRVQIPGPAKLRST
jgi:hypothetical protein